MSTAQQPISAVQRLAGLHKALSDETRIRILHVLSELGELCVCDIESGLEITQSKASRHLGVLRQAGLLRVRRDGTWIHYRVSGDLEPEIAGLIATIHHEVGATREGERDVARTRELRRRC